MNICININFNFSGINSQCATSSSCGNCVFGFYKLLSRCFCIGCNSLHSQQHRDCALLEVTQRWCILSGCIEAGHAQQYRGCGCLVAAQTQCSLSGNGEAVQSERQHRDRQCSLPTSSLALGIVCITLFYHVETFVKQYCNFSLHLWFMKFSIDMTLYDTCRGMSTNNSCQFSIWISFLLLRFEGSFYILYTSFLLDLQLPSFILKFIFSLFTKVFTGEKNVNSFIYESPHLRSLCLVIGFKNFFFPFKSLTLLQLH